MSAPNIRSIILASAFALAGCGGGGGGVASISSPPATPTPTPTPTPSGTMVPAAATSQQFAAVGASHTGSDFKTLLIGSGDQLQVRYVESSHSYEVQLPQGQTWSAVSVTSTNVPINYRGDLASLWLRDGTYLYSRLFEWADNNSTVFGHEAIGVATPASGVPVSGSATYAGQILGQTSEYQAKLTDDFALDGSIALSFNFGFGSLSGSISVNPHQGYAPLAPINFRDTVYSTGSTIFSGRFDTNLSGVNSFSGLFTGPNAQELIGNFAFPYTSPIDGQTYQADGAFVAKK